MSAVLALDEETFGDTKRLHQKSVPNSNAKSVQAHSVVIASISTPDYVPEWSQGNFSPPGFTEMVLGR
jgi:hypothetical protein